MPRFCFLAAIPVLCLFCAASTSRGEEPPRGPVVVSDRALEIHRRALLFDGHNDLPWVMRKQAASSFDQADISQPQPQFHTDIERLRRGGVGAQFWSAYAPAETRAQKRAAHYVLEQIDLIRRMAARYPDTFEMALTADDVERIRGEGKIASLIGVEGGHAIEDSLALLRLYHSLGVRYMTLTHSESLDWADSATGDALHDGLTPFGEDVVRTMNDLGMLVDISHVSEATMLDVLRVTRAPVIASHSSAYALASHPRNVSDRVLKLVADNGGVVMVNFYSGFIVEASAQRLLALYQAREEFKRQFPDDEAQYEAALKQWRADHPGTPGTIHDVVDHIDHIVKVAGIDHCGIGSDFDGVDMLPDQLEDVSTYPRITQLLLDRGYTEPQIAKILGGNVLRVLRRAEQIAGEK